MKIELSNGYVILRDFITHKASTDYQEALFKGTRMKPTGKVDELGNPTMDYDIDPVNANRANEAFVVALIEKVVVVDGENEKSVTVSKEWLENMDEDDFVKVERAALEIKARKEKEAKKS